MSKQLDKIIEEKKENCVMDGGDYNARTGREGGVIRCEEKERCISRSNDIIINREGQLLIEDINEKGWMIAKGCE